MQQRPFLLAGLLLVGAAAAFFVGGRGREAPPPPPIARGENVGGRPGARLHGRAPPREAVPCPPIVATAPHCGYGVTPGPHLEPGEARNLGPIQLDEGRVLEGRVMDAEGTPLVGVDVSLWTEAQPIPPGWSAMWRANEAWWGCETDEAGRFAFRRLPPGDYWVRAHAHDGPGGERVREHVPAGTTSLRFVLTPADDEGGAGVAFRVIAVGPDGWPIPDFDADLTTYAWHVGGYGSPEEAAELTIEDERPPYRILVYDARGENDEALGYAPVLLDDVAPRREPYVVRMEEPGCTIRGRVEWDGAPRAWTVGAWGEISADGRSVVDQVHVLPLVPSFLLQTRSDASGAFEIRGLPPGHVVLTLGLDDRNAGCIRGADRVVETGTDGVVLEVQPASALHLVVRSPAGSPIDAVRIRIHERKDSGAWLRTHVTVEADAAGTAVWDVPGVDPDRRFRVVAEGTWKAALVGRAVLERVSPREAPYVLELEEGPEVSGRVVTPEGKGVPDATVRLYDPEGGSWRRRLSTPGREQGVVTTDAQGRFTIRAPHPGRFFVAAVAPGLTPLPSPPLVEGGAQDVQIVLRPCYALRGRIHDPSGETLPAFLVTALPVTEGAGLRRESDLMGDGFFEVPDLSAGSYRVVAWPGWEDEDDDRYVLSSPVEAGTSGLALDIHRGGILVGRVVTEQGEGVPWADVRIEGSWTQRRGDAGENGHYRFGGLAPGAYVVRTTTPGGGSGRIRVRISKGRNAADIVLSPR